MKEITQQYRGGENMEQEKLYDQPDTRNNKRIKTEDGSSMIKELEELSNYIAWDLKTLSMTEVKELDSYWGDF